MDVVPHVMTALKVLDPATVHIVWPNDVPNPNRLHPGSPSAGQQRFGDDLACRHDVVVLPSVVSAESWNLIFDPRKLRGRYRIVEQKAFALDGRLHPVA
jgi:RES domain-containing protein